VQRKGYQREHGDKGEELQPQLILILEVYARSCECIDKPGGRSEI